MCAGVSPVPGRGEPSPGADVGGVGHRGVERDASRRAASGTGQSGHKTHHREAFPLEVELELFQRVDRVRLPVFHAVHRRERPARVEWYDDIGPTSRISHACATAKPAMSARARTHAQPRTPTGGVRAHTQRCTRKSVARMHSRARGRARTHTRAAVATTRRRRSMVERQASKEAGRAFLLRAVAAGDAASQPRGRKAAPAHSGAL